MENFENVVLCKNYLKGRYIKEATLTSLEEKNLITYHENRIEFVMRDLDGNVVGIQERYLHPINLNGNQLKSKTKTGTHVGYFYTDINFTKPIIITEGEIDTYSLGLLNVVGLQGISGLRRLVEQLQEKKAQEIYILTDNDEPSNKAIGSLLDFDRSFLSGVYDSRLVLATKHDINEYIPLNGDIVYEKIKENGKNLNDYLDFLASKDIPEDEIDQFVKQTEKGYKKINQNKFARYLITYENFGGADGNPFKYDSNEGIRVQLNRQEFEGMIIDDMEKLLQIDDIRRPDLENIVKYIRTHAENKDLKVSLKDLRQENSSIYLKDCIYDVISGEKKEYKKEYYILNKFEYDSTLLADNTYQQPTRWLKFLDEILEGQSDKQKVIDILQEFIGLLFIPNTKFERALILLGDGCNGKSVLLYVIQQILGDCNCSSVGLDELNNNQNQYLIFGKLANIDGDCDHDVYLDKGIIKKVIDGSTLLGKEVYKKPINFTPFCRLLLAANEFPKIRNKNDAIIRRFLFINFKQSFVGNEDRSLKKEIPKEKNGIFVRAIQGLKRLLERGDFSIPKELGLEFESYIDDNDSILQFIESDYIQKSIEEFTPDYKIYSLYIRFCKENDFKPLKKRKLNERLESEGYEPHRRSAARGFKAILKR